MVKRLLSLFDYSGNWSEPYKNAGWEVTQIDIKLNDNILIWNYRQFPRNYFNGILATVPCTDFSKAGVSFWKNKDEDGQTLESIALTYKTLAIIQYFAPNLQFWVIENPVGRIHKLVEEISQFRLITFEPYEFGDAYSKKTILYGYFNPFFERNFVAPVKVPKSHYSIDKFMNIEKISFEKRKELRSLTPKGFANAFFKANN